MNCNGLACILASGTVGWRYDCRCHWWGMFKDFWAL